MIVDLAREFGVSVFIYLSSQLVQNSFDDPNCKNEFFAGKLAVERYIQSSEEKSLSWMYVNIEDGNIYALLTVFCCRILRPAFYMEGFTGKPGPFVAGVLTAGLKPETKVHLTVRLCFPIFSFTTG